LLKAWSDWAAGNEEAVPLPEGRGWETAVIKASPAIRGWEQIEKKALACRPQDWKSFSEAVAVPPLATGPRGLHKDRRIGIADFLVRGIAYFLGIRFALSGGGEELPHRLDRRRIAILSIFLASHRLGHGDRPCDHRRAFRSG
jgi:hypothetical protein